MEEKIKVFIDEKPEYIDDGTTCDACYLPLSKGDNLTYGDVINPENDQDVIYGALVHEECANDALSEIWWSSHIQNSAARYVMETTAHFDNNGEITNSKTVKKVLLKEYKKQKFPPHSVYTTEELYRKYWGWITGEREDDD